MKKIISKNQYYELVIDTHKNRFYLTHNNFWRSPSVTPNYLAEIETAIKDLKPGFTTLQDNSQYAIVPQEVATSIVNKAEKILYNAHSAHTAIVLPEEKVARLVTQFSQRSQQEYDAKAPQYFSSKVLAEEWLDQLDENKNQ